MRRADQPCKAHTGAGVRARCDTERCLYAAECVRELPSGFETGRRPWITPGERLPRRVGEIMRWCPAGALHSEPPGGQREAAERPARLRRHTDGSAMTAAAARDPHSRWR
jgi:uncharacterized Fe-S cluster protein YjdI